VKRLTLAGTCRGLRRKRISLLICRMNSGDSCPSLSFTKRMTRSSESPSIFCPTAKESTMAWSAVGEEKHDSITSYSSEDPKRMPPGFLAQFNILLQPSSDYSQNTIRPSQHDHTTAISVLGVGYDNVITVV
jgi:hypothetical protein